MTTAEQTHTTNATQGASVSADTGDSPYPRRRSYKRWIFLASFVILAVAGAFLWHYLSGFESTDDAQVDVHLYPVSARISGYIQKVNVEDNQWVDAGSTLVEIDPKDNEVALARAQATLATSEAAAKGSNIDVPISSINTSSQLKFTSSDIKNAEAAIEAAEKQAAAAQARVLEAQAENVKAQDDVTRYHLLLAKEEVPKQIYDHAYAAAATDAAAIAAAEADEAAAQQAVQEAHSRLTEAEAHYEDAQAGPQRVASTRAKALSAMADAHQKEAAVEQAQLNLGYTKVFAPVAGEVTKKVVVGLNVEPGEQMLTVVPLDQVWITANFKETQLKHMRVGQKVKIDLDANGRTYRGHVDSIAGATGPIFSLLPPENATGNYVKIVQRVPVKIVLEPGENQDHQLRPGMNVENESVLAMSATALAHPSEQAVWRPRVNPWAIAATVSMAAFIEVLDTSVANVALPYIAGDLGASYDDSTWVLTSYLAANAIVLPISGWLAEMIGRKRYFMISLAIFTLSSLLCGLAPSLPVLLFFRAIQGIGGGGLQPMAQAILNDTFPPEKRGQAFALYGVTAVLAPTVGPMLGGWITDSYSWRWIFFITLPVVLLALYLTYTLVEDPPFLHRLKSGGIRVDYIGISMLVLGVGSLQVVLDKGQEDDWFGSHFITTLIIAATVCLVSLVIWEWFRKDPIIDVRMFKSFNFAAANLMMFMMGFMLFSTLVLLPEFLQTLMGYTAELAGLVLSGGGVILLVMMPVVGRLTSKVQARWLIATGWLSLAIGLFYCAHQIDLFVSFRFAMWLRVAQVIGIGFLFVPITAAGYIGVPPEKGNSVSGMINFMRNIGGSIGTSVVTTMIARRAQYHQQILIGHITPDSPVYRSTLHALSSKIAHSGLRANDADDRAIARFYELVQRQGGALSYMDIFWVLGALCSVMFVLAFFLKKNDPGAGGDVAVG